MSSTAGIDLAADPKNTSIVTIDWAPDSATVTDFHLVADDDTVARTLGLPDTKIGVDCPLGWPVQFAELLTATLAGRDPSMPPDRPGWRDEFTLRDTDRRVREITGIRPLSVAADKIGVVALRLARILSSDLVQVRSPRDGSGALVEVYPAAALKVWGFPYRGYKGVKNQSHRDQLVDLLTAATPWLQLGQLEAAARSSDDVLDALISALVARAAQIGWTQPPPQAYPAAVEGWIHVPTRPLDELLARPS